MSDVWDTAAEATVGPKVYFGQIFAESFYVYKSFKKGDPSYVLFDPSQHSVSNRYTLVKIDAVCARKDGSTYEINREMECELDNAWQITKVSLKTLGVHPRDLNESWAKWEMVEDGESWISKRTGQPVQGTTFKFLEFYPDEEACRAAEKAYYSRASEPEAQEDASATHPMPEPEDDENEPGNDKVRANLARFLRPLWLQAGQDVVKYGELLQANPALAEHFDLNSPEVLEVIGS